MRQLWHDLKIRALQLAALHAPGATTTRPWLHRRRGVTVGRGVFIGTEALIETSRPELISIGHDATIGIRSTLIAHFFGGTAAERNEPGRRFSVVVEDEAYIGPSATILPGVTIGRGAVVAAGSVVTSSVPPMVLVQGNPARPVARCGVPLNARIPLSEFYRSLRPFRGTSRVESSPSGSPLVRSDDAGGS